MILGTWTHTNHLNSWTGQDLKKTHRQQLMHHGRDRILKKLADTKIMHHGRDKTGDTDTGDHVPIIHNRCRYAAKGFQALFCVFIPSMTFKTKIKKLVNDFFSGINFCDWKYLKNFAELIFAIFAKIAGINSAKINSARINSAKINYFRVPKVLTGVQNPL